MMLTEQQVAFFEAFGFLQLKGWFSEDMARLSAGYEEVFTHHPPATVMRYSNDPLQRTRKATKESYRDIIHPDFVERSDNLDYLLNDPRVVGVVTSILGAKYEYFASDGHRYHCETGWHKDIYGPAGLRRIKLAMYLDRIDAESGAIRVIPGTHLLGPRFGDRMGTGLFRAPCKIPQFFGVEADEIPAWPLNNEPGDLVVWHFETMHASYNGAAGRRSFALNFRQVDGAREAKTSE